MACRAWSEVNEPRVATAYPSPVGKMIPSDPSALSVTVTGASKRRSGAPGWSWLKNFGYGRASTAPVTSSTISPRQASVTGVQACAYAHASV